MQINNQMENFCYHFIIKDTFHQCVKKNNIKCILNVTIEITSSKVINLTKSIKICFDLNHLNSSILLQRFAFKGIISEYGEDLHVYRGKTILPPIFAVLLVLEL